MDWKKDWCDGELDLAKLCRAECFDFDQTIFCWAFKYFANFLLFMTKMSSTKFKISLENVFFFFNLSFLYKEKCVSIRIDSDWVSLIVIMLQWIFYCGPSGLAMSTPSPFIIVRSLSSTTYQLAMLHLSRNKRQTESFFPHVFSHVFRPLRRVLNHSMYIWANFY